MRSVMQYWEPERPLEPKDYDMPVCPVCGEETASSLDASFALRRWTHGRTRNEYVGKAEE